MPEEHEGKTIFYYSLLPYLSSPQFLTITLQNIQTSHLLWRHTRGAVLESRVVFLSLFAAIQGEKGGFQGAKAAGKNLGEAGRNQKRGCRLAEVQIRLRLCVIPAQANPKRNVPLECEHILCTPRRGKSRHTCSLLQPVGSMMRPKVVLLGVGDLRVLLPRCPSPLPARRLGRPCHANVNFKYNKYSKENSNWSRTSLKTRHLTLGGLHRVPAT